MVDLELAERVVGSLGGDHAVVADLREIAHAAQQAVRDTRRPARTGRDLPRAGGLDLNAQQRGRTHDNALQFLRGVQLQTQLHAETVAQGAGKLPGSGRCADEGKARQIEPDGVGRRALADDDIDSKILHSRIQNFLDRPVEAVNFVDEQNIARREIRQQRSQISGLFDRRAGGHADARAHFVGDDACERRLAETRRAVEQDMVERLIAPPGSLNINGKVALGLFLSGIVGQQLRAQADLAVVLRGQACGDDGRVVFL